MTAQRRGVSRLHAGYTTTGHEHVLGPGAGRHGQPLELATDERIHGAAARLGHGTLGHADEAAQTLHDLIAPVGHDLVGKLGVG